MAKPILISYRDSRTRSITKEHIRRLSRELVPDNITPREPLIIEDARDLFAVFQPAPKTTIEHGSLCLGALLKPVGEWWKPGDYVPDGSFSIIRRDDKTVELVTDALASRNLWYALTEDMFIAASSIRAIVACLRSYEPNRDAQAWMLSAGNIGWGNCWDKRIQFVPPNSRLELDRKLWKVTLHHTPTMMRPEQRPEAEFMEIMDHALRDTLARMDLDYENWLLLLTGGYNSRHMLLMGMKDKNIRTLCWGLKDAPVTPYSDAWVAKQLAEKYHVKYEFRSADRAPDVPAETVIRRFVENCEGRVDNFTGYLDGLLIYKEFYDEGVAGLIRGECAFGYYSAASELVVRQLIELLMFKDYGNLDGSWPDHFGEQNLPEYLRRRSDESLYMWRDRLYQDFTAPLRFGALNELKCWYAEIVNPIINREIVNVTERLPDRLRTGRYLYNKVVARLDPAIPFAMDVTPAARKPDILRTPDYVRAMTEALNNDHARGLLSDDLVKLLLDRMQIAVKGDLLAKRQLRNRIGRRIPKGLKVAIRKYLLPTSSRLPMDFNILAFRALIVVHMDRVFHRDAQLLS